MATFGKTSLLGTETVDEIGGGTTGGQKAGGKYLLTETGTVTAIKVPLKKTVAATGSETEDFRAEIYRFSDGALMASSNVVTLSGADTDGEKTFTFASNPTISGTDYYLMVHAGPVTLGGAMRWSIYYENTGGTFFFNGDSFSDGGENPLGTNQTGGPNRKLAIYAVYTAGGTAGVPSNTSAPQLTGATIVGQQLASSQGGWSNTPTSYSYQFQRSLDGATGWANVGSASATSTYTEVSGDTAYYFRAAVTATNATGSSSPAYSNVVGPVTTSTVPTANIFGLCEHDFNGVNQTAWRTEMDDCRNNLGCKWMRIYLGWSRCETSKGVYNWTRTDQLVQDWEARAGAGTVMFMFLNTPSWARGGAPTDKFPPVDMGDVYDFLFAAANRYKPGGAAGTNVTAIEVWNEPNIDAFWRPQSAGGSGCNAAEYTQMLIQANNGIKAAAGSAITVVSAGLSPAYSYGYSTASAINGLTFIEAIYANGGGNSFDAIGWHPYSSAGFGFHVANAWSQMQDTSPSIRSILAAHGDANVPTWATEVGDAAPDWMTEQTKADRLTERYQRWQAFTWPKGPLFTYARRPSLVNDFLGDFGLVDPVTQTHRLSWNAYAGIPKAAVGAPVNNGAAPSISGVYQVGQVLTADPGGWSGSPTFTYQWKRSGSAISGANAKTYALTSADNGVTLTVAVTGTNASGSATAESAATPTIGTPTPVNTSPPVVTGNFVVGGTLVCSRGTWSNVTSSTTYAFQWRWNVANVAATAPGWNDIAGATSETYVAQPGDAGRYPDCRVIATNP